VTLDEYLADRGRHVEEALARLAPAEEQYPGTIHRAMRYSLFAGGKRIRPVLCIAAGEAVAGERREGLAGIEACAATLELVHTYSLIHDDLPALDNDDFRRGKPTCHKVFGDAMAILAGDALLTLAFRVLSQLPVAESRRVGLVAELSQAAGTVEGMIGGQVADLEAEGKPVDEQHLHYIHRAKTGAMIRASVRMGAVYCGAPAEKFEALGQYGEHIGLAFQIVDDILDVEGTPESLGKTPGKDAQQQKATFPALYGVAESRRQAVRHLEAAKAALGIFGDRATRLHELAERIVDRSA
jgi:geranylgeranyl diphosphate synthase, type II